MGPVSSNIHFPKTDLMKNRTDKSEFEIQAERKAKRFYIGLVLLLFAIQCTILGSAINLAIGDPALAVVPDYHHAALHWDESQAALRSAKKLGWRVDWNISDVADGQGLRAVQFEVRDAGGNGRSDLTVNAKVYHHGDANSVQRFQLDSIGDGCYQAMPPMARSGLWQIELDVENAGQPMTFKKTVEL